MSLTQMWGSWLDEWKQQAPKALGSLEQRVMEWVWSRGEISVRDLHREHLPALAYTTLMTTLDRLYRKGLLQRRKAGRAFLYSSRLDREQFERAMAERVLGGLLESGETARGAVLSSFVDAVSQHDSQLLDELEELVRKKRRMLRRSE